MNARTLRFRLGLFVLLALVLMGVLVVLFGTPGMARWFRSTSTYFIIFPNATGVAPGTPVRLSGVRIGEVTDVGFIGDNGDVKVTVDLERRFPIRRDQVPTLSSALIGGDAVIDFIPKKPEKNAPPPTKKETEIVPPGSTIAGVVAPTVGNLVTRASEVVQPTQELMNDIRKSLKELEKLSPEAERSMKDFRALTADVRTLMPDARRTLEETRKLATALNEAAPDIKGTTREVHKLTASVNEMMPDVRSTVRDLGATAQQYNKLGENLDKLVRDNQEKIVRIVDNFNATLDRTLDLLSNENRRNITDTLRNLRTSSDHLPETAKNLDEGVKAATETAKRLRETLNRTDEVLINLREATKPLAQRGDSVVRNLDETLDKLNKLTGDFRELMRVIDQADGTFRRFLTDPALYNHLDEVICMAGRAMPRLDRILKDFETFADKLARHPESIGLPGLVKPGSGLKDPPTAYPGGRVVPPGY